MTDILAQLEKILTLSTSAMVLGICLVTGYAWRFIKIKWFPNDAIPVVVIVTGALSMLLLADIRDADTPTRIWVTRHIGAGLILGLIAWLSHSLIISKLETYLASKFEFIDKLLNTTSTKNPPAP